MSKICYVFKKERCNNPNIIAHKDILVLISGLASQKLCEKTQHFIHKLFYLDDLLKFICRQSLYTRVMHQWSINVSVNSLMISFPHDLSFCNIDHISPL